MQNSTPNSLGLETESPSNMAIFQGVHVRFWAKWHRFLRVEFAPHNCWWKEESFPSVWTFVCESLQFAKSMQRIRTTERGHDGECFEKITLCHWKHPTLDLLHTVLQDSVSILPLFRQHFIRYILYSELYLRTCFFCKCRQLLVYSIPASVVELPLFVNLSMNLQCVLLKLGKPVLARDSVG
jgi:hypothetical protein